MNELAIICNLESPQEKNSKIVLSIVDTLEEDLLYKYMIGSNGTWTTLKDFSDEKSVEWIPKEDGKYIIMVQAKIKDGHRSFDYVSRIDYIIGKVEEKLINNLSLDQYDLNLGEKLNLFVDTNKVPLMFRYWLRVKNKWEIIKDYSADNTLTWVAKSEGKGQILVECKNIDSKNNYDDFESIEFEVRPLTQIQITDFKCLNSQLIEDTELIFKVESLYKEGRTILYKFIKINSNGESQCVQDYSTQKVVNYVESKNGEYKLLCLAKDMYSTKVFDTRVVINFRVKKYNELLIRNFTSDLSSPQLIQTPINLSAEVIGGREVVYRYIINGSYREDSGYIRNDTYVWKSKMPGKYKITLWVKDKSFEGTYEAAESFDFIVDERSEEPVKIDDILIDKKDKILINEKIQAIVHASGGTDLKYSFIIRRDGKELEKVDYGSCNWINFIPKEQGEYELDIRVKDKYSSREFDSHSVIIMKVLSYIPAKIDYVLFPLREYYMVGDKIILNVVTQNTKNILMKYELKINNHKVEETDFVDEKGYAFTPKCSGTYTVEIFAKSIESDKPFDSKKEVRIEIHETLPVTNTKITSDKVNFLCNEPINFTVQSEGGKDIVYEFFLMEKGEWNLVQNYSKKSYYTFMPFSKDEYKILVLAKSQYTKDSYEDYDTFTFNIE
jgi:Y_Y_Y domain.